VILEGLEATGLAQHLRASRWTYPLVNTGHLAGIALLVGSVVPMDLRLLRLVPGPDPQVVVAFLRPFAIAGVILAMTFGGLLFVARASEYAENSWFRVKIALLALAVLNAVLHLRVGPARPFLGQAVAAASLLLWPAILLCGRMIGYS
jgi:hypothetical protein